MTAATASSFEGMFWRPYAALQVAHGPIENRRLAATLLAAIFALSLIVSAAPQASSLNLFGSETRVAAQTDLPATGVGSGGSETPAAVGPNGAYSYDGVLGCCAAPGLTPNRVADAVDFDNIRFSNTAAGHASSRPYVDSPLTLQEIVRSADPIPDPGGLPNGWRWEVPGSTARSGSYTDVSRNTTHGTWEVVIDLDTNTVVHFLFRPGS